MIFKSVKLWILLPSKSTLLPGFKPGLLVRQTVAPVSCKETGSRRKKEGRRTYAYGNCPRAAGKQSEKFTGFPKAT